MGRIQMRLIFILTKKIKSNNMRKNIFFLILLLPTIGMAQQNSILKNINNQLLNVNGFNTNQSKLLEEKFILSGTRADTFDFPSSVWLSTDSSELLYNSDTLLSTFNQLINDADTGWISNRTSFYLYDANKNDTTQTIQSYDIGTGMWNYETKLINTFDVQKNILSVTIQLWDNTNMNWFNGTLITNSYDANNNLLQQVYFAWSTLSSVWDSTQKLVYTYDANNNRITEKISGGFQTLFNQFLTTYSYNAANLDTLATRQVWNSNNSSWKNSGGFQDTLAYDANNNLLNTTRWNYNQTSHEFDISYAKTEYEYNIKNQVTKRFDYNGDGASAFIPTSNYYYSYDLNSNNDTLTIQTYDAGSGTFENYQRTKYWYTSLISSIKPIADNAYRFKLYPNPANETIQLSTTVQHSSKVQVQLTDANGRILSSYDFQLTIGANKIDLNLGKFPAGIYFAKVINKETNAQTINRFVKQ